MYPICLGLVDTRIGYIETIHQVKKGKEKFQTVTRGYDDLFGLTGFQPAAVETWGGLHFLPLITSVFLSHHGKGSFESQLDSGVFGFDKFKGQLYDDPADKTGIN